MLSSFFKEQIAEKSKARGVNGFYFSVKSNGDDMKQIAGLLEKGIIKSHVSKIFPFEKMADAHLQIETGRTVGKIIVTV